jgi:hypothetical protein
MKGGVGQARADDPAVGGRGGSLLRPALGFAPASSPSAKPGRRRQRPGPPPGLIHQIPNAGPSGSAKT